MGEQIFILRGIFCNRVGWIVTTSERGIIVNINDGNGGTVTAEILEGNYRYCDNV